MERIQATIDRHNQSDHGGLELSMSMGMEYCAPECRASLEDLIMQADDAMYAVKRRRWGRPVRSAE